MWDPGTLAVAAVLLLPTAPPAPDPVPGPVPRPGDACIAPLRTGSVLYLGDALRACPGPQRPTPPLELQLVPRQRPGAHPSDE